MLYREMRKKGLVPGGEGVIEYYSSEAGKYVSLQSQQDGNCF